MKRIYVVMIALFLLLSVAVVSFSEEYAKGSPEEVVVRFLRHVYALETREAMALVVAEQQAAVDWSAVEEKRKTPSFHVLLQHTKVMQLLNDQRKIEVKEISPTEVEVVFDHYLRDVEKLPPELFDFIDHIDMTDPTLPPESAEYKERIAKIEQLEKAMVDLPFTKTGSLSFLLSHENREWRIKTIDGSPASSIALYYLIIPEFSKKAPCNASAQCAGHNAKIVEEMLRHNSSSAYTDRLTDLLEWDKNLTDDPDVTFIFGPCNASGYTFTTSHAKGDKPYVFTD